MLRAAEFQVVDDVDHVPQHAVWQNRSAAFERR
jgi:hypothetical protein